MLFQALVLAMVAFAPLAHAQEFCSLPLVTGPCRAAIPRFGFSTDTGQCEPFFFGGCGGNGNSFETLEDCDAACGGPDICSLRLVTGPCRAGFLKWGFSQRARRCVEFTYGGCLGNENRFDTEEECMEACP